MKADYPFHFFHSVTNEFQNGKDQGDKSFIISLDLFRIAKPIISIEIPQVEPYKH